MMELLSPAGGWEAMVAAVQNGADAVYMGFGGLNARRSARNFTDEEFREAVAYCHLRGVKVYLTLNTLVTDRELPAAAEALKKASDMGVDAILIQDWGIWRMAREIAPEVPLHASTQMSIFTSGGALEAAVSRAVDDPAEFCADLCVPLGYRTFDVLSDGARTVVTASRFVGELEVCNASLIFTFSGSTLTTVTGTFLPPIDTSESGETAFDAVTALVRFLDYRNASGAVCTGITWLSAGYLVQSTTSAPLQLVPVLRVDTDVYSYYVNIVSGEVSRVSA